MHVQIVTYGFNPADAPLEMGGTHLSPQEFHDSMADKDSVVIDVRNFNETAIGRFQPPGRLITYVLTELFKIKTQNEIKKMTNVCLCECLCVCVISARDLAVLRCQYSM